MAYHVYQTKALILQGSSMGDANRFVSIFTRELGLVRAVAKSARRERSKLRYSLQDYSFGNVALVRGREVWRITGAKEDFSVYYELRKNQKKVRIFVIVVRLVNRLVQGEEKNELLFDVLSSFITYLLEEEIPDEQYKALECLIVMRVLYSLGYIEDQDEFFESVDINHNILISIQSKEKGYVLLINQSLKESHL